MIGYDLLLFHSVAEVLGMFVVEAQAEGLTVLASDSTPQECVVDSQLVQFLSLELDPEAWSAQALQLLTSVRNSRRPNAMIRQSNFSIENSAKQLTALYGRVLKS